MLFNVYCRNKRLVIIEAKDIIEAIQKAKKYYPDYIDIKPRVNKKD